MKPIPTDMRCTPLIFVLLGGLLSSASYGEVPESVTAAREFFYAGRLEDLSQLSRPEWRPRILAQPVEAYLAGEALLSQNRRAEALTLAAELEESLPRSMVGPFLRFRDTQMSGRTGAARELAVAYTNRSDLTGYWWSRSSIEWVLLGKMRLAAGTDAKVVLETCFQRALRDDPSCEEAFSSVVELALGCGDAELAASRANEGLKRFPKNALLFALLGNALQWTSPKQAVTKWSRALELNPNQSAARMALAEMAFVMEDNRGVREHLDLLPKWVAEAEALRLACAYIGSSATLRQEIQKALSKNAWALHRAGTLLSARYRFTEGAELQRTALASDPALLQAKRALAEDLMRLGRSDEAWPLLEEVHSKDGYDITVFNLLELRDRVASFTKLESDHFDVWMAPVEALVYGARVTKLLEEAYAKLTTKYRFEPSLRTTVEIFPEQKDFAVRTFGVPGGDGYLGVCFGPVITAPSPASPRASGHSWEATLWHEFTHTLTLSLTRNQMPRWLSEGISVHEEQQAHSGWGHRFRPRHAGRLLGGQLTPVEQMADAFRSGNGEELDFAYFQAGLIVEWMVKKSGPETLRRLLEDLGKGIEINTAISKRYGAIERVNADFLKYAAQWAKETAGKLRWRASTEASTTTKGDVSDEPGKQIYENLIKDGEHAFASKDYETARKRFEYILSCAPRVRDSEDAFFWLQKAYRALGLEKSESDLLLSSLQSIADFPGVHVRLLELYSKNKDWQSVAQVSEQYLGVSPMSVRVFEGLATAYEHQGQKSLAVDALKRAFTLDPDRSARWHSRIGILLEDVDPETARQHLLDALEVNPRDQFALEAFARIASHSANGASASQSSEAAKGKKDILPTEVQSK